MHTIEHSGTPGRTAAGLPFALYGDPQAAQLILQPVDAHDAARMQREAAQLLALRGRADWCIAAVPVRDWNADLTPWESPPVFGEAGFGCGAAQTLAVCEEILAHLQAAYPAPGRRAFLCGYSLAGLFALWSACQTDAFAGVAAVSPSVWYPGWSDYAQSHAVRTGCVYLSLGLREEKTKNKTMATVGDAIRAQHRLLSAAGVPCTLEWNEGNHFVDSEGRTAKGLAWLLAH